MGRRALVSAVVALGGLACCNQPAATNPGGAAPAPVATKPAAAAPGSAPAAPTITPSLVGLWSHHSVSPQTGQTISEIWDEFAANGQLHTHVVTSEGSWDLYGTFQVLNGGSVTRATYTDWEPKQICTLTCSPFPYPSVTPLGQPADSSTRFDGPNVVYFGGDMYTRQQ